MEFKYEQMRVESKVTNANYSFGAKVLGASIKCRMHHVLY